MRNLLQRFRAAKERNKKTRGRSLLVFEHTGEVIQAEKILKSHGLKTRVMGPPPEIRTGCDMVVEVPMVEELQVLKLLAEADLEPLTVRPVDGPLLEPVSLYQVKDFGDHLMVRAANMKLTVDKKSRVIVNVSGGGCPDVPYVAALIVGRTLEEAPSPRDLGSTLCGYALHLAYEEVCRLCSA
ncbi:MAG: DUF3343 domain-containing protein [Desulfovibrio sp.]|nr:MAG: DUF3343 domain-containing protein [Desulfovibrio sp.]